MLPKNRVYWLGLIILLCSVVLFSQTTKIQDIQRNSKRFKDEVVSLEGFVTQFVEGNAQTTSFYYLKDDWGGIIKVRTSRPKPEVGKRYSVRGPVGIDPYMKEVYISEELRTLLTVAPVEETKTEAARFPKTIYILIGAIVVVAFILVILLLTVFRKKPTVEVSPEKLAGEEIKLAEPAEMLEGKTVKMAVPPAGTLKLLPGKLITISGEDKVKEIRFYKTKAQDENEITFGRASGRAYNHIQLKSMTVSAKQAKLIYAGGKFTLINYSSTNPSRVNDVDLEVNGSAELKDGDKVEMGEVAFEFKTQ
jgi:hypothetical protein